MITMTTDVNPIHGTRLWVERVYAPVRTDRQFPIFLGVIAGVNPTDNSTGVSAVERRHR